MVTNNHVVRDGTGGSVVVHLNDGRDAAAQVVGTDPETDIAVLKIDLPDLKAIEFADSDQADVGDWVIALGAPFGLKDSVTAGIISAKGREVGLSPLESYLQTDATINPGKRVMPDRPPGSAQPRQAASRLSGSCSAATSNVPHTL